MNKKTLEPNEADNLTNDVVGKCPGYMGASAESEKKNDVAEYVVSGDISMFLQKMSASVDKLRKNIIISGSDIAGNVSLINLPKPKVVSLLDDISNYLEEIRREVVAKSGKKDVHDFTVKTNVTTIDFKGTQTLNEEMLDHLKQIQCKVEECNRKLDVIFKLIVASCDVLEKCLDVKTDNNEK